MLDSVLRGLPRPTDPNVLVGFHTNDDAGVYLIGDGQALVQTVDFFTPIVDDPAIFGQVAAANSLSDIYAMGGKPVSALSIVGFPESGDVSILGQILRGGLAKMEEARCAVIGGHSIRNEDIQFGYAVTGLVDPKRMWRNLGAKPGDALLLTKPLGTGVLSTALKKDKLPADALESLIVSMTQLNREAAEALRELEQESPGASPVHAVTDVTGFGLLGHAREMALGDPRAGIEATTLEFDHQTLPLLPGALEAASAGFLSVGLANNRQFLGDRVSFAERVPQEIRHLCFDPQTSGGLLIAVSQDAAYKAQSILESRGIKSVEVGRALPKQQPLLLVR